MLLVVLRAAWRMLASRCCTTARYCASFADASSCRPHDDACQPPQQHMWAACTAAGQCNAVVVQVPGVATCFSTMMRINDDEEIQNIGHTTASAQGTTRDTHTNVQQRGSTPRTCSQSHSHTHTHKPTWALRLSVAMSSSCSCSCPAMRRPWRTADAALSYCGTRSSTPSLRGYSCCRPPLGLLILLLSSDEMSDWASSSKPAACCCFLCSLSHRKE